MNEKNSIQESDERDKVVDNFDCNELLEKLRMSPVPKD